MNSNLALINSKKPVLCEIILKLNNKHGNNNYTTRIKKNTKRGF